MKYLLIPSLLMSSLAMAAGTGAGSIQGQGMNSESSYRSQRSQEAGGKSLRNSEQRMEERQNNSAIIYGADQAGKTDGRGATSKDIRPQGQKNAQESDYDVEDYE